MSKTQKVYPIQCQLTSAEGALSVTIVKMGHTGFLINSLEKTMKVNAAFTATFTLPIKNIFIETKVTVFKTYDEFKGTHGLVNPGNHVAEMVFQTPSSDVRKALVSFFAYLSASQVKV